MDTRAVVYHSWTHQYFRRTLRKQALIPEFWNLKIMTYVISQSQSPSMLFVQKT